MTKGEATRQRIIEQAAPLFNKNGLAGSSIEQILDAIGLEKGGLYRHFASKRELAAECLKYSLSLMIQARVDGADGIPGSMDKLRFLVDQFASTPSPLKGGCPLLNAAVDADDGDPELRRLSVKALRDWKGRLREIVEAGIARGEIRSSVDPCAFANISIAILEGSILISRLERSRHALDDARQHLHRLIDELAAVRPGNAEAKISFDERSQTI